MSLVDQMMECILVTEMRIVDILEYMVEDKQVVEYLYKEVVMVIVMLMVMLSGTQVMMDLEQD